MQKPIVTALANHGLDQKLVYLNPTDPFNMYLKISFLAGIFVASPLRAVPGLGLHRAGTLS